jgi:nucleotide-binding universal stress UspA family protein
MRGLSIVCPIDFSESSRSALAYAAAIAEHFGAHVTVLSVVDPLLASAAAAAGVKPSLADETRSELERFCGEVFAHRERGASIVGYHVAIGKPAEEILRTAHQLKADLIVISSRGRSGFRKLFFGSTTERVLREAHEPVLITPDSPAPATSLAEIARHITRVLAPVDLSAVSQPQISVAHQIAKALSIPLLVAHVMEPIFVPSRVRQAMPGVEDARKTQAHEQLSTIVDAIDPHAELMVLAGDPSNEIIALSDARRANLIVMGLHSSGLLGPRMGSVTYRVLCRADALVLALPPEAIDSRFDHTNYTAVTAMPS